VYSVFAISLRKYLVIEMKTKYIGIALAWLVTTLLLTACGGGGSDASQTPTQTITGTAASGAALAGASVTIKDSTTGSAKTATGIANSSGTFSIPVSRMTPPFMLIASPAVSGQLNLYSVLPAMDMTTTNTQNVNVTSVTTLVMYELNGGADPASMYSSGSFSTLTGADISTKELIVRSKLPPNTVNAAFDMMYSQFTATGASDSTGYDAALDGIGRITGISSAGVTFSKAFTYTPATSNTAGTAEGVYTGSTTNGSSFDFDSVVLEDGSYYILYGIRSAGALTVLGFAEGNGASNNGGFTSSNMVDFTAAGTVLTGTLSAVYSANSFGGSVTEGGVTSSFLGTTPINSAYVYNTPAKLTDITGAWTLSDMQGGASTLLTIAADGSFSTSSGGCNSTGTLTPRPSGKNIFDFTTTFGASPCKLPGQTATGIAVNFLLANGMRQFVAAGSNAGRTVGTAIFGTRAASSFNYTIGGTVSGLTGTVVLQNNSGDNLTVSANGSFTFPTKIANGNPYNVSVLTQPAGQTCSVSTGAGTVSGSNISNVTVVCSTNSYTVGGSVSGLSGTVVLQNNGGDNLTVSANGSFTFATQIASGSPYSVTVFNQPNGQSCSASNGAGTMSLANVTSVSITCSSNNISGYIYTVAGNGVGGFSGDGGSATSAQFFNPNNVALDDASNLYVSDEGNQRIRKVDTNGIITTVAGNGSSGNSGDGGPATSAGVSGSYGLIVDAAGNLYISGGNCIRKVDTNGIITTVAGNGSAGFSGDGGPATSAKLNVPYSVAVDSAGNLYVADSYNHRIRKVDTNGIITTVAGSGSGYSGDGGLATSAQLFFPSGVTVDGAGNLFISDTYNFRIRKVDTNGIITTVAGSGNTGFNNGGYSGDGGPATSAQLNNPFGIVVDSVGNLYIADTNNDRIRKVDINGIITTVAGSGNSGGYSGDGGLATSAQIDYAIGVAVDAVGNLYIADSNDNRVRKVIK